MRRFGTFVQLARTRLGLLLLLLAVVVIAVALQAWLARDDLSTTLQSDFAYPDATTISSSMTGRSNGLTGSVPAQARSVYGTNDSPEEVMSWYASSVESRGWEADTSAYSVRRSDEVQAATWRHGDLVLRVGIRDPTGPYADTNTATFATVINVALIEDR